MNYLLKISLVLGCLILSSCATIFSGTTQKINIVAIDAKTQQPLQDVSCHITDGTGSYLPIYGNPGTVVITRTSSAITPRCTKDGYTQKSFGVGNSFNGTTIVNVLFWPGFLVDAATGAMHKAPSHITILMERN
ncbi:hypothetical protein NOVO_04350 [Rickettsiales bacterium Ac37b]|nr:hypothetical protein NOVO_04350 [Rickettsiales bacterium Ac37b]